MNSEKKKVQNCVAPIAPFSMLCTTSVKIVSNNYPKKQNKSDVGAEEAMNLVILASLLSNKARNVICACEVKIVV